MLKEQVETFDQLNDRLDNLEVSLSKTENIVKDLGSLAKKIAGSPPPKVENSLPSKAPQNVTQIRYHTVTSGETLQSISHRYGLQIEKIRHLNKLSKASVIYPGQKLLVSL